LEIGKVFGHTFPAPLWFSTPGERKAERLATDKKERREEEKKRSSEEKNFGKKFLEFLGALVPWWQNFFMMTRETHETHERRI
jgi:hypothetical protein